MTSITETRKRLESKRFPTRQRGMKELLEAGYRDEFIERLLAEKDAALVSNAVRWIDPDVPPALLVHMFHLGRQPTPMSEIRSYLPYRNCLYAEAEIFAHYAKQGKKMAISTIDAIGYGYLRSFGPVLEKIVRCDLELAADAVERVGPRGISGGENEFVRWAAPEHRHPNLANEWSADSQKVFAALAAMRRIDHPVAPQRLDALKSQVRQLLPEASPLHRVAMAQLHAAGLAHLGNAEFAAAVRALRTDGTEVSRQLMPDLGTDLLKRGLHAELRSLVGEGDPHDFYAGKFCHWPLMAYLLQHGLVQVEPHWGEMAHYLEGRAMNIPMPPWAAWVLGGG